MGNGASASKHRPTFFIDFEQFKKHGSIPRNPECEQMCTNMSDINRDESVIVFVSHVWITDPQAFEGSVVDNNAHRKYNLVINGVNKLIADCASKFKKCFLWLDYSCLNQDENTASQLHNLDTIIGFSDCLFTPLLGTIDTELSYSAIFSDLPQATWNTPGSGYLHRAWCRTEMFYASNIASYPDSNFRINKFKKSLHHFSNIGRRPHYVYGALQDANDEGPVRAPLLQNTMLKLLTPEYGQNSVSEDHIKIMELTTKLKPALDRNGEGYFGETKNKKMHGKGLLRFQSGAMYQGEFSNGKKNGTGTFVYATGNVYTGGWLDDAKHGMGDFRFISGNTYKGMFRQDKKNGQGFFSWTTGETYEGNWVDDLKHGKGCTKFADGSEYSGDYFEDHIEGEGLMKYCNGDVYKGDFVSGKRYGHGVLTFANGDWYDGQFIDGAMQGRGCFTTSGKEVYEGNFYNNDRNGHGTCQYSDGEYVGNWLDGKRHGQGTFSTFTGGNVYIGDWFNDLKHGFGKYKSENGTYEGQYQSGQLHGKGTFTYPNGDVYEGVWLKDKKQGKGTYVYAADGKQWIAMWRDDELIEKIAV